MELLIEVWDYKRIVDLMEKGKLLWHCVLAIVCWVIWRECNAQFFNSEEVTPSKIPGLAFFLLFSWVSHLPAFCKSTWTGLWAGKSWSFYSLSILHFSCCCLLWAFALYFLYNFSSLLIKKQKPDASDGK